MKGVTFNVLSLFIVKGTSPVLPALEIEEFFHVALLITCFSRVFLSQDIKSQPYGEKTRGLGKHWATGSHDHP